MLYLCVVVVVIILAITTLLIFQMRTEAELVAVTRYEITRKVECGDVSTEISVDGPNEETCLSILRRARRNLDEPDETEPPPEDGEAGVPVVE